LGTDGPHFEQVDTLVADQLPLCVSKDPDSRPYGVWTENIVGKGTFIHTLKDLALDGIKFADEAILFLFSKTAWIDDFARCTHCPMPLPVEEWFPNSIH